MVITDRPVPEANTSSHEALEILGVCKAFHCLPRPGGLLDQDSLFVHLAGILEKAESERMALDAAKNKARTSAKG